jgi:hypothetical protein
MAICVIAEVGLAPCQCFSPGANQTTSPGRISSTGPPQCCAQPRPDMTINVWPNGCVCQAVRAPGSNVTFAPRTRAGSGASNNGSIRTLPVNQSAGPLFERCDPFRLISIYQSDRLLLTRHFYFGSTAYTTISHLPASISSSLLSPRTMRWSHFKGFRRDAVLSRAQTLARFTSRAALFNKVEPFTLILASVATPDLSLLGVIVEVVETRGDHLSYKAIGLANRN